jgi:hypothetical protein
MTVGHDDEVRDDAARTLLDVERVRRRTRQALHPIWFSNLAVGAFFVGTAVVMAVEPSTGVALAYWIGGGLLALGLIVRHYARVERDLGVESPAWDASTAVVLAMVAGAFVTSSLIDDESGAALVYLPAVAGTVALGLVLRDAVEVAAGGALAVIVASIVLVDPSEPGIWGNLGLGLALFAAGLAGRTMLTGARA